jgi:hypothetical protein
VPAAVIPEKLGLGISAGKLDLDIYHLTEEDNR